MQFDSFEWQPLFSSKVMFKVSVNYRKNSFSLIIRRLCILCLKRFKQQILNFCDKLWQGGVVMWCSPRFWGECFSVAFKKQSRDCVNFVSYRSRTLLLVHNNSVIFQIHSSPMRILFLKITYWYCTLVHNAYLISFRFLSLAIEYYISVSCVGYQYKKRSLGNQQLSM